MTTTTGKYQPHPALPPTSIFRPAYCSQREADYVSRMRGIGPWDDRTQPPCRACGAGRAYGELHCDILTPPIPKRARA